MFLIVDWVLVYTDRLSDRGDGKMGVCTLTPEVCTSTLDCTSWTGGRESREWREREKTGKGYERGGQGEGE